MSQHITNIRLLQCLANKPWFANYVCDNLRIDRERVLGECIVGLNRYKYDNLRLQKAFQDRFRSYFNYVIQIDTNVSQDDINRVYYIRKSFHRIVENYKLYLLIKREFQDRPNPKWLQSIYKKAGEMIKSGQWKVDPNNWEVNPNNELTREPTYISFTQPEDNVYLLGVPDPQKLGYYFGDGVDENDVMISVNKDENTKFEKYLEENVGEKRKKSQKDVPLEKEFMDKVFDDTMKKANNEVGKRVRYNFWLYDLEKNRSPYFSMRDLTGNDIDLLRRCKKTIEEFISTKYNVDPSHLMIYIRYPYDLSFGNLYFIVEYLHPQTVYNFFYHVSKGVYFIEKVINILETNPNYFQEAAMHFDAKRYDYVTYYQPFLSGYQRLSISPNWGICKPKSIRLYINRLMNCLKCVQQILYSHKYIPMCRYCHDFLKEQFQLGEESPSVNILLLLSDGINLIDPENLTNILDKVYLSTLNKYLKFSLNIYYYLPLDRSQRRALVDYINDKLDRKDMKIWRGRVSINQLVQHFNCSELKRVEV